jgi:nucleotide-binding universal stress UspA family protein
MKILIAADGSQYTKRMLAYLAEHAEWLGAAHQYTVLTAIPAVPPRAVAVLDKEALKTYYTEEAEKVLKPIRTSFKKLGLQAEFIGKVGHAAEVIAKQADAGGYDLLMMGSHGNSSIGNLVMGSVVTKVMSHCKAPVLIVR